jgi:beta-glucosidase
MTEDQQAEIETLLGAMTLEEKIGQLIMIRGSDGTGGPKLSDRQLNHVRAGRVGSVIDVLSQEGILTAQTTAVKESRLRIPLLVTLDVLHGYRTIFPIPLGEAASFSPPLW